MSVVTAVGTGGGLGGAGSDGLVGGPVRDASGVDEGVASVIVMESRVVFCGGVSFFGEESEKYKLCDVTLLGEIGIAGLDKLDTEEAVVRACCRGCGVIVSFMKPSKSSTSLMTRTVPSSDCVSIAKLLTGDISTGFTAAARVLITFGGTILLYSTRDDTFGAFDFSKSAALPTSDSLTFVRMGAGNSETGSPAALTALRAGDTAADFLTDGFGGAAYVSCAC